MTTRHPEKLLDSLVSEYHHVREELRREGKEGSWRRRFETKLEDMQADFERALSRWVQDDDQRRQWREHIYHQASRPDGLELGEPPLFVGESQSGTSIFVRLDGDDTVVTADGSIADRRPAPPDEELERTPRSLLRKVFPNQEVREVFGAPEPALGEFVEFVLGGGGEPPWEHARELYSDGLIDVDFSVTGRGRRLVNSRS
jgi:hypothetical protein